MEHTEVGIQRSVLADINYQYELECVALSRDRVAQCYLLLGQCTSQSYGVSRSIQVPLGVTGTGNHSFEVDVALLRRRYELVKQVLPAGAVPLGLMLVNSGCYNYDEVVEQSFLLNKLGLEAELELLLKYEPGQVDGGEELRLECLLRDPASIPLAFNRVLHKVVDSVTNVAMPQRDAASLQAQEAKEQHASALDQFVQSNEQEDQLAQGLLRRVDRMVEFLQSERDAPPTHYDEDYEAVLRKVSLLVSQLELGGTEDIENEVLSMENELKVLQIACNQWEMATPR